MTTTFESAGPAAPPAAAATPLASAPRRLWADGAVGLVGLLLLGAGVAKALAPTAYLKAVAGYQLLPHWATFPVGTAVMGLEIALGAVLWVRPWRAWSVPAAAGLLALFAGVMTATLLNQLPAECGCQLPLIGSEKVSWLLVGRNVLLALALLAAQAAASRPGPPAHAIRAWLAGRSGALATAGAFAALGLAVLFLHQKTNVLRARLAQVLAQPPLLRPGEAVTPFRAVSLPDRRELLVSFDGHAGTFLFVFSPHCPHCRRALARLNERADGVPAGVRLLGVTLGTPEGTEQYLREVPARFPVCAPADLEAVVQGYRLFTFPQVIEIDREGKVVAVSRGVAPGDGG